jgi:large-conductance mechanosensitive channel
MGELSVSIFRLRWVGYALFVLSLLDSIAVLIPPNLMNPAWELQTIGALVERVPVPLLGLALIFMGEDEERGNLEEILLKVLSWVCLLSAVIFLLMLPLGIFNTVKLNSQANTQIAAQSQQQLSQLQAVEDRLQKGSAQDLKTLAEELKRMGLEVKTQNPEELKNQILARITPAKEQLKQQANAVKQNQGIALIKTSVKWMIGAVISAILFFTMWKGTDWAR